jgi:hypothetical protein
LVLDNKGGIHFEAFENRVLRGIFRLNGGDVTGEWRKLHNEELHNLFSSPSKLEWSGEGG